MHDSEIAAPQYPSVELPVVIHGGSIGFTKGGLVQLPDEHTSLAQNASPLPHLPSLLQQLPHTRHTFNSRTRGHRYRPYCKQRHLYRRLHSRYQLHSRHYTALLALSLLSEVFDNSRCTSASPSLSIAALSPRAKTVALLFFGATETIYGS